MKLLDPYNLDLNYEIQCKFDALGYEGKTFFLINDEKTSFFIKLSPPKFGSPDIPNYYVEQFELLKKNISWLIDSIENKFWKSAAQGGLPSGLYTYKEEVAGERLAIYREMNVGAQGQKGFRFTNFSRHSRKYDEPFQDFFVTDLMLLEGGLLKELKKL
ncbi:MULTISPECIES: hypothetical protein [unclassified Shewanella]|uniref:hypothetical protein n=1 Tax=unclassified Shewanella TaxID=196818 RepID=UPI000C858B20|nr:MULTISPECIES: hypothetical protein [unclassified Shewanella]PMG49482.1 hypothetical protein BCU91_18445 [Shewanella sp. 10N.286.52.B9]PMG77131.1 hypothetical protein BCU84_01160 [Shewanella sp. 10N.286.51.B7]